MVVIDDVILPWRRLQIGDDPPPAPTPDPTSAPAALSDAPR
jgi:hypothetical protein